MALECHGTEKWMSDSSQRLEDSIRHQVFVVSGWDIRIRRLVATYCQACQTMLSLV
jgi:hypothetical protein